MRLSYLTNDSYSFLRLLISPFNSLILVRKRLRKYDLSWTCRRSAADLPRDVLGAIRPVEVTGRAAVSGLADDMGRPCRELNILDEGSIPTNPADHESKS